MAWKPLEDETPESSELFGQALSMAGAITANAGEEGAELHIGERRQRMWKSVDAQRHRARRAVSSVRAAECLTESSVRRDEPRMAEFCDEARREERQAIARAQHFLALAEQVRQTRNRSPRLTEDEARWIDGLLADMEQETEAFAAWLHMVRHMRQPGSAPDDTDPRRDRTPSARPRKDLNAEPRYEKVLQKLSALRRVAADIAAERKRAEEILSDEAQRTAISLPRSAPPK
jgi:hypothetical protein